MKGKKSELAEKFEPVSPISPENLLRKTKKKKVADSLAPTQQKSLVIEGSLGPEEAKGPRYLV